ncbi:carboxypeptidase N subunit 2-like [Bradysia coprophila]|uniref:carboxypeptidase N subunit 2-like n=1 Tax=Bradysia coprophila TaxID=38358 RepID=UPI00187DAFA2|nr:carboxypeptidase N subunit 2-like [Bradysia coprophila]
MFRGRNTKTDHTMRWLFQLIVLMVILAVNDVRCASTMENATIKPAAEKITVISCTLTNITDSQPVKPSSCYQRITYLFIKNSRISVFPHIFDYFPNLQSVDISSAGVEHIESTTFDSATHLDVLEMGNSNMQTLPNNLFTHVNNLTSLDLSNSSIEIVEQFAFHGLSNLKRLDLSGNKIVSLDRQLFLPLSRLQSIRLSNNKIQVIDRDLFMHNSRLMSVYLSSNDIISVDPNAFMNCILVSLDLGSNQLNDLDLTTIKYLKELIVNDNQLHVLRIPSVTEKIEAKNNSIVAIESDETNKLVQLYLSANHFTNFSSLTILNKLQFLDLSANHIRNFAFSDVKALTQLKELQLCRNKLPEIKVEDVVTNLPKLKILELSTKHWSDSYVEQLQTDLKGHGIYLGQNRDVLPDDDSPVVPTIRPTPVPSRTTVNPAFTTPNSGNVEPLLKEIQKQLSDLEYRMGANAAADSKKMDRQLAGVEDKLMKSNEANDAKLEVLRSSFKVYEVLVIIMAVCVFVFLLFKLVVYSKRMLNGMQYRRAQSSDPIFSEQDL